MDDVRFDALARIVSTGTSRRGVLRGIFGAAATGALSLLGVPRLTRAQCTGGGPCSDDSNRCPEEARNNGVCEP